MHLTLSPDTQQIGANARRRRRVLAGEPAPDITVLEIGPQTAEGDVPVSYLTRVDTACIAALCPASAATPGLLDFYGADPSTYTTLGSVLLTRTGAGLALDLPDDLNGVFKLALLPRGGGDADVTESGAVALVPTSGIVAARAQKVIEADLSETAGTTQNSLEPYLAAPGENRLLLAHVSYGTQGTPGASTASLSLGGQAFSLAHSYGSSADGLAKSLFFYLHDADLPETPETVTCTVSDGVRDLRVVLVELRNVNQSTPVGATVLAEPETPANSHTGALTTTAGGSLVLGAIGTRNEADDGISVVTDSTGALVDLDVVRPQVPGVLDGLASYEILANAGTRVEHTWTWGTSARYGVSMIEVLAA